jgi:hypothetical protein
MRSIKVWVVCAAVVLIAITSYGSIPHVLYGKRIAGQVVDAGTGQPINGAHVAFLWESDITPHSFTAHNSRTICYHAAAAVTNEQGYFEIAPWREWSTYGVEPVDPVALVYVRGYTPRQIAVGDGSTDRPTNHVDQRYALKKFEGTVNQRMDSLFWNLSNRDCPYGKASQRSLFAMLKAIHSEARSIATSDDHRSTVSVIATIAAEAALAIDPTGPGNDSLVQSFIETNLK